MVHLVERIERDHEVQDPLLSEAHGRGSERLMLDGLEDRSPVGEFRYSWLESYLERLEGKEARHEYYARLEQTASP